MVVVTSHYNRDLITETFVARLIITSTEWWGVEGHPIRRTGQDSGTWVATPGSGHALLAADFHVIVPLGRKVG